MSNHNIRNAVRFALTAGVAASFVNAPAALAADDEAKTELDRVEVTGSRIKRTQLEGAMPVTAVTREDIEKTGINSIGDLLQELPAAGAALNTNFNNGGDGSTRIDLRNLGSNRVLVLVNGRRWVNITGGSGSVDLNTIPISIIERIEVLKDGASAVYGSDAIAGVVNIITRKDFDGASANATIGEFDEGDGRQEAYDFSVGSSGSRSSAFFNASYYKAEPVWAGDRNISMEPTFGGGTNFGSSTVPNGRFRFDANTTAQGTPCTTLAVPTFWCGTGGLGATHIGAPSMGVANPTTDFAALTDFYNFAPDNYLATPSERWSIYAQGRYDVTDNITFTTEALFNKRISEQLLAAMPVVLAGSGRALADGAPLTISGTNPYNPFPGHDMVDTANTGVYAGTTIGMRNMAKRFTETGGRSFNQDVSTYRFGAGFEGNFEAIGRVWDWNVNYTFTDTTEMDVTYGLLSTTRLKTALGPVASCISPCVPLNFFGGDGGITQAQLDYVTFNAHDNLGTTMRNYSANISGEIFDLPAGPVGLAAGFEYRQEEGYDDPDALIAAGNTTGNSRTATGGSFSLTEFYAEFALPILKDMPLAEDLEISVAMRASDYDTFGSTTNTKFGIRWQPFSDLLVRATFQEGFRAPNIAELYLGQSDSYPTLQDACSVGATNGGSGAGGLLDLSPETSFEAQTYSNCLNLPTSGDFIGADGNPIDLRDGDAQTPGVQFANPPDGVIENYTPGITGPFVPQNGLVPANMYGQANQQIRITVGGNPNLDPETAESTTFGFVYSPSYLDGLSVTLDWYEIAIDKAIVGLGATTIMNGCYGDSVQEYCDLITRQPTTGDVDDLFSSNKNVASFTVSGIDLNVVYRAGELPFVPGEWKFTWDTAFVDDYEQCVAGSCADYVQINLGDGALPAFKSNLDIDWSWGDWEATWRMRFIGRQYENCTTSGLPFTYFGSVCSNVDGSYFSNPPPTFTTFQGVATNALGATTYHSVQVSYNVSDWDTRFTFGIQNVGDKAPPISTQAFANSFDATTYEVPGRFPYFRVSKTF
jgi:iron complex outermembrane receptor protein